MLIVKNAQQGTSEERRQLHAILITAYALTEVEVWGENYERITFEDYNLLMDKGEILVAIWNAVAVGGVHYYERRPGVYSFSLLCADFDKNGLGIGRALIDRVEQIALANGASHIEIEILRPKGIEVPFKIRIRDWYLRQGFCYTHSQNFASIFPERAKKLVNPSDFDYYMKSLTN